jgi:CTP synthase (UTP-ammonia lyase)
MTNVAGLKDITHPEYTDTGEHPVIVLASCPAPDRATGAPRLSGKLAITIAPGTLAAAACGRTDMNEDFTCNYELNPVYADTLTGAGMRISGVSADGGARIIELPTHRFYLATGFLPQYGSAPGNPHPLITAFLAAAAAHEVLS